ncbi:TPA: hypothetical protein ACGO99_002028, partial [Enterococcus faecium]
CALILSLSFMSYFSYTFYLTNRRKRGCDRSDQLQEIRRNLRKLLLLFLIWLVLFPQRQAFDSHYEQGDVTQILSHLLFLSLDQKILILDTHTHFVWI